MNYEGGVKKYEIGVGSHRIVTPIVKVGKLRPVVNDVGFHWSQVKMMV